jgi:hypothetical protein
MCKQNHRVVGCDLGKRTRKIVFAAKCIRPGPVGELVCEPGDPEARVSLAQQDRTVLKTGDAGLGKCPADNPDPIPPVMIAENGPDPQRRVKPRQLAGPDSGGHPLGDEAVCRGGPPRSHRAVYHRGSIVGRPCRTHSTVLRALGGLGAELMKDPNWHERLGALGTIDWSKQNKDWENVCIIANSVVSNRQARAATKAYIKAKLHMELTESEKRSLEKRDAA